MNPLLMCNPVAPGAGCQCAQLDKAENRQERTPDGQIYVKVCCSCLLAGNGGAPDDGVKDGNVRHAKLAAFFDSESQSGHTLGARCSAFNIDHLWPVQ